MYDWLRLFLKNSINFEFTLKNFKNQLLPNFPNYGLMMKNGCNGIAKNVMNWPAEMVLGGIRQYGKNVEADGLF